MNGSKSNLTVAVLALLCLVAFSISREPQRAAGRSLTVVPKAPSEGARTLPIARGAADRAPAVPSENSSTDASAAVKAAIEGLSAEEQAALQQVFRANRDVISTEMLRDPDWIKRIVEQYHAHAKAPEIAPPQSIVENPYERLAEEGPRLQPERSALEDENNPYSRLLKEGLATRDPDS